MRSSVVRVGPTLTGFADDWDLTIFEELMPRWQRFGIQRHWNMMQPEDVAAGGRDGRDRTRAHVGPDRRGAAEPAGRAGYLIATGTTGAPTAPVSGSGGATSRNS